MNQRAAAGCHFRCDRAENAGGLVAAVVVLIALTVPVAASRPVGGLGNGQAAPAISVEDVLLAADRMRADRWYPEESLVGDDHGGRLSRAADMDMLMLAVKHPIAELRYYGVRELGRFETPENIPFLSAYLDDPDPRVRTAAADALVQSVVDRPDDEALPAIAAIEERLKREVLSPMRGPLWVRLAELPLSSATAARYEREWTDQIVQMTDLRGDGIDALLARARRVGARGLQPSTESLVSDWALAGLQQRSVVVLVGMQERGATVDFLRILQAIRADNTDIATGAALFECGTAPAPCGDDVRDVGVQMLNPHNPAHLYALDRAAKRRYDPLSASTAVRKLITAPGMPLCTLLDIADGLPAEPDVIEALSRIEPERYNGCGDWNPTLTLARSAGQIGSSTRGTDWVVPARAQEALARRFVALGRAGPLGKLDQVELDLLNDLIADTSSKHVRWQVRVSAARAARTLEMSDVLVEMLEDEQHNVKAEVLQGLAALRHPALWAGAVDALQFPDLYLLRTAVDLLRGVPRPAAIREPVFEVFERVSKAATDTSRRTRLAMVERLGEAIQPDQPDAQVWINRLRPYLNDYDPEIARATAGVIEAIGGYRERPQPTRRPGQQPNRAQLMAIPPCITITVDGQDSPILLDRGIAPIAIARLVSAINSGYYNGTVLHAADENFAIFGNPGAHDEGGLPRFIRDEVGARHDDPHLVLMGHARDEADGRLAIRYRDNPARFRRETVLGRVLPRTPGSADQAVERFNSFVEGATITRVWVGAPEPERRLWCGREVGIPPLDPG